MDLGAVVWDRFLDARKAGQPEEELLRHLDKAARLYHEALDLLPPDAVNDVAVAHNALGQIYGNAGDLEYAMPHYRQSIQLKEQSGNFYGAARTRYHIARSLLWADCRADALEYAEAALRGFESYGERAAEELKETRGLIAKIRGT